MAAELAWMALLRFHARQVMQGSAAERAHFGRRLRWPWALYGALWGCSVLIFAGSQGASAALMVSWLILVCIGALSIAALLGASPGASVTVSIMLNLIERCFADKAKGEWAAKLKEIFPAREKVLEEDAALYREVAEQTSKALQLA